MKSRHHAMAVVLASLLALVILAAELPGDGETSGHALIDCKYENPELNAYANQIPSCAP